MNAAVMTTRNEADIVERSVTHLLDEGIDQVWIADQHSDDGTFEILTKLLAKHPHQINLRLNPDPYIGHGKWTTLLANWAGQAGADWILPCDADEFPVVASRPGLSVGNALWETGASLLTIPVYDHKDHDHRFTQVRHAKMAFRYEPGLVVHEGNHWVDLPSRPAPVAGVLEIREFCYRSFEHFKAKVHARNAQTTDEGRAEGWGGHHLRLEGATDDELATAWKQYQDRPAVWDPMP